MIKSHELFLLVLRLFCDCAWSGDMSDWHFQSRLIPTPPLLYRLNESTFESYFIGFWESQRTRTPPLKIYIYHIKGIYSRAIPFAFNEKNEEKKENPFVCHRKNWGTRLYFVLFIFLMDEEYSLMFVL